jgi:Arc/MetJ-type ribon-helix-helix transcriptional regulator
MPVSGRKQIRKEVRFDGYTGKLIHAMMATGDFSNVADLIRVAIQNLYNMYETNQIPAKLRSTPRILSRSVATPEEQKPVTASRSKKKKSTTESVTDVEKPEAIAKTE